MEDVMMTNGTVLEFVDNGNVVTASINAHLKDIATTRDQVAFKLMVAELFGLSVLDLHAQFSQLATAQPAVCVAAGGAMLQSLEGVITAKALRQREVICRAVTLASAEVIAADRTATEDEDE